MLTPWNIYGGPGWITNILPARARGGSLRSHVKWFISLPTLILHSSTPPSPLSPDSKVYVRSPEVRSGILNLPCVVDLPTESGGILSRRNVLYSHSEFSPAGSTYFFRKGGGGEWVLPTTRRAIVSLYKLLIHSFCAVPKSVSYHVSSSSVLGISSQFLWMFLYGPWRSASCSLTFVFSWHV